MASTETEMRDSTAPTHQTIEELTAYVQSLVKRDHDYGTCVYAMSLAATAAFNFVASQLGVTGFQASCADMDILRRTRRYKGPFMVVDIANALYPQYDLPASVRKYIDDNKTWLRDEANKLLAEPNEFVVPAVREHWVRLAEGLPAKPGA